MQEQRSAACHFTARRGMVNYLRLQNYKLKTFVIFAKICTCDNFPLYGILWTPCGGPGGVSCIERLPHFRGKFMLGKHTMYLRHSEVSLIQRCPYFRVSFKRGSLSMYKVASITKTFCCFQTYGNPVCRYGSYAVKYIAL